MKTHLRFVFIPTIILIFGTPSLQAQDTDVLIMVHGGNDQWNQHFKDAVDPVNTSRLLLNDLKG